MVDWAHQTLHHPHVFILGAGASRAARLNGDANGKKLPLMDGLVETLKLTEFLRKHGFDPAANFEVTYAAMYDSPKMAEVRAVLEDRIRDYFSDLALPTGPTLYDYLLLGLREKDLIATFNWDPLLFLAYGRNERVGPLPQWAILHGNVRIGVCHEDKRKGRAGTKCDTCGRALAPVPLLFPITEKDYASDPLIKNQWEVTAHRLEHAYWLTFVGYRAPQSDAEAIRLLKKPWLRNKIRDLAQIEIVDVRPREDVEQTWNEFPVRDHYAIFEDWRDLWLFRFPRRSCESFFAATQMNDPWKENRMPMGLDLPALQRWISPLLEEERIARAEGGSLTSHGKTG